MSYAFVLARRAVLGTLVTLISAASSAVAEGPVLSSHVPAIVQNGRAHLVAPMNTGQTLRLALNLPLRNEAALDALLADLYNPKSPNFHKWLSQPEFEARFGPTEEDKKTLVQWALDKGFEIKYKAPNGRIVEVDAPVSAVNKAFHVNVQTYHDTVLNRDFHAPDREPTTDLKIALLSVDGLEDSEPKVKHSQKDPKLSLPGTITAPQQGGADAGTMVSSPMGFKTWQPAKPRVYGSGPSNLYLPSDMRAAYYGNGPLTGTGQIVGIFSFDGYVASDIPFYYASTGFSSTVPITNVLTGTFNGACTSPCDDGEQVLDIVNVQGMAPGLAGIRFYENGTTANTELNIMVTDNLAKTISNSWGGGGFGTSSDTYFKQMATQGQSYLSATGDFGGLYRSNYSAPSLDPYITQVGGTELVTNGPGGQYVSEVGWDGSSGGYWITGISTSGKYTIPTWQTSAVTSANGASTVYRNVPDIAAEADYDNPTVSNGVFEPGYGGTSFATPRYAGYIALANQQAIENGATTLGFLNPAIYTAAESSYTVYILHDVTTGSAPGLNESTYAATGPTYTAVAGFDLVTGWGSPVGPGLINALGIGNAVPDFVLLPPPVSVVNGGSSATVSIPLQTYSSFSGSVTLAVSGLPAGVTATTTSGTASAPPTVTLTASGATMGTYNVTLTGTSPVIGGSGNAYTLTHTATLPVTVLKRAQSDFTLSAPAVALPQNGAIQSAITITTGSGLVGGITLTVSGLPTGMTGTLSVTTTPVDTASSTSVLTFTDSGSLVPNVYNITVTGTSAGGIVHTTTIPVTVYIGPSLLQDGGFESGGGSGAAWTLSNVSYLTTASTIPPHTGTYFVLLDGGSSAETSTVSQQVSIPAGKTTSTLGFWYWVLTAETGTTAVDKMSIQLTDTSGNVLTTLGTISNLTQNGYWAYLSYNVSPYIGQTVVVKFVGVQAGATYTDFLLDDVSLVAN